MSKWFHDFWVIFRGDSVLLQWSCSLQYVSSCGCANAAEQAEMAKREGVLDRGWVWNVMWFSQTKKAIHTAVAMQPHQLMQPSEASPDFVHWCHTHHMSPFSCSPQDELDIGFGEVFLSYFSTKKSFDVCLPLVVDSQCLTLVFHEVHPREASEVVYNDNPVSVAFPRFWSYSDSKNCSNVW